MAENLYNRLRRLRCERWAFAHAMHGWRHPHNIEWAQRRKAYSMADELAELRRRYDRLEAANRHDVADEPQQSDVVDDRHDEQGSEPVVIRRRGGLHHAK
jgi:hypothetical protein